MDSPMVLSMRKMREAGYRVYVTEKNIRHGSIAYKQDLFGFADLLCLRGPDIVAVQTTSLSNVAARVKKITEHEETPFVRDAGIGIIVHGWGKDAKGVMKCREIDLS